MGLFEFLLFRKHVMLAQKCGLHNVGAVVFKAAFCVAMSATYID